MGGGKGGGSPSSAPPPALRLLSFWIQIYIYIFIGQEVGAANTETKSDVERSTPEPLLPPRTVPEQSRAQRGLCFKGGGGAALRGLRLIFKDVFPSGFAPPHAGLREQRGVRVPLCVHSPVYRAGGPAPRRDSTETHLYYVLFGSVLDINCVIFLYTF